MSGAFWIKVTTAIWDDEKIKIIEAMPERDSIMVIWFKLLTQAGKCNEGGRLQLTDYIPLDAELMAGIFNRTQADVERALAVFKRFGMVECDDMEFPFLPNWHKHQNIDALEKLQDAREKEKEANKRRVAEYRERQKAKRDGNVTVTITGNGHKKENKELELESDKEKEPKPLSGDKPPDSIPFSAIVEYLNQKCGTAYKATSEKTKTLIRARWSEGHRVEHFQRVIHTKQKEWGNDPEMCKYLRPETLFGTKFESYLNQKPKGGGNGGGPGKGNSGGTDYSAFIDE